MGRLLQNLTWKDAVDLLFKALVGLSFAALFYLRTIFATVDALGATNDTVGKLGATQRVLVETISPKVDDLTKWRLAQAEALHDIKTDLASLRTLQSEQARNTQQQLDRIYHVLDSRLATRE